MTTTTKTKVPRKPLTKQKSTNHLALVPDSAPVPVTAEVVDTKATDATPSQPTSREEACQMVLEGTQLFMKGSELMRQGILYYRNNGFKLKDLEKDLRAKGWEGAYSSLGYHQSNLRKEGLLAEATQGARADLKGTNRVKYKSYREDHVTGLECDKRNLEEQVEKLLRQIEVINEQQLEPIKLESSTFQEASDQLQQVVTCFKEHRENWTDDEQRLFDQLADGLCPPEEKFNEWSPGPKVEIPDVTALSMWLPTRDHTNFWSGLPAKQQQQIISMVESGVETMSVCKLAQQIDWSEEEA